MKKLIAAALLLFAANVTFAQRQVIEFENTQTRMLDVVTEAIFKPMVVEVEMMDKGKVRDSVSFNDAKLQSFKGDVASLRSWATFISTMRHNADVLVAATYDVYYNSDNKGGYVIVVGFPARFKNWHTISDADLNWINTVSSSKMIDKSVNVKTMPVNK